MQEYDGKYLSAFSPDGQGISEDTVQVGDELPVYTLNENGSRNENPIPVTAILRGMKEEDVRNPQIGGSGISMIVGKNFWKKFGKSRIMEYDQIVKILVSDDADAYDTEGHILSILKQGTAVNVQNNHEEYKKIRQELYSFIGMYSIFAVFYMILISIVLYQMFLAEKQEEKKRRGNLTVTWNGRKVPEENASDRSSLDDGMRRSDWSSYVMGCLPTDIEEASR